MNLEKMTLNQINDNLQEHKMIKFLFENDKKLVLYGGGSFCEKLLNQAEPYLLPIQFIVDMDEKKDGSRLKNYEIKGVSKIIDTLEDYKFIITTSFVWSAVYKLKAMGVSDNDIYFPVGHADIYNGTEGFGLHFFHAWLTPIDMYKNWNHYITAYNLLMDERSKLIFKSILMYRLYGLHYVTEDIYNDDYSYFNNEFIDLSDNEVFVDIGAYNGDTVIEFLQKVDYSFDKIYAIEANSEKCIEMKKSFADFNEIEVLNCCVGDKKQKIKFDGFTCNEGENAIQMVTLNEILGQKKVSIIKMDIEGMEKEALIGAKEIIQKEKPKLAICIYHLVVDIWKIIELIHEICPTYRFCIGQPFDKNLMETVLYAF